eukprot:TRINITY_DN2366_c0_g1_i2.p1 TRINITY_DN2366_c0_g1~~TRINITY_DN2366_c0_g1_i2.p1  ORF type:complete len:186 (+),score=10.62 TRINITY_DN2366_c0_g1_i2:64-621(+)
MDNESPDSAFSEKDDPEDDDDPEIHGDDILDGGAATPAAPLSDSLDDVIAHPDGSRDDRNFSFLCWNVAEQLKQGGPQTRDELSDRTGFSRQRVCTVISVFKAIGLVSVRENDTKSRKVRGPLLHSRCATLRRCTRHRNAGRARWRISAAVRSVRAALPCTSGTHDARAHAHAHMHMHTIVCFLF